MTERSEADRLAADLERAVESVHTNPHGFTAQVPVARTAVIEAREDLLSLARELYHPEQSDELSAAARRARAT